MDHNLYGMNLLHASAVKFRKPVRHEINGNGLDKIIIIETIILF